ncbi:hypothetical protein [Paenibacillus sp. sgz5001063]|uniref:hypothetical protein n=1 Tax=Paenibacillus sp. sgz5001063 TaxID=3242474 RepID=UPI0036D29F66
MSNFNIFEFYGKNENLETWKLWVSIIMCLCSVGMFLFNLNQNSNELDRIIIKWALYYISIFTFSVSLFISSNYFFEKKEGAEKYAFIRKLYFLFSFILLIIVFLPLKITFTILNKLKMETLYRYSSLYGFSFITSILINTVMGVFIYVYTQNIFGEYVDSMTISLTFVFIMNYFILKFTGTCYFYFSDFFSRRKKKLKQGFLTSDRYDNLELRDREDKKEFMNVIYVLNFVIIAVCSMFIYFINLEKMFSDFPVIHLRQSVLYSFTLFAAFDRLWDKWKKTLGNKKNTQLDKKVAVKSVEEELLSTNGELKDLPL